MNKIEAETGRTALYRLYDATGRLLYVGVSEHPAKRFVQHRGRTSWWRDVARKQLEWHPDRDSAEYAELAAIQSEHPIHNRAGTGKVLPPSGKAVGKPHWAPSSKQAAALVRLRRKYDRIAILDAVYRERLVDGVAAGIPILHIAAALGIERKSVYRHLGKKMT